MYLHILSIYLYMVELSMATSLILYLSQVEQMQFPGLTQPHLLVES